MTRLRAAGKEKEREYALLDKSYQSLYAAKMQKLASEQENEEAVRAARTVRYGSARGISTDTGRSRRRGAFRFR